jgi:hypothetical protein
MQKLARPNLLLAAAAATFRILKLKYIINLLPAAHLFRLEVVQQASRNIKFKLAAGNC